MREKFIVRHYIRTVIRFSAAGVIVSLLMVWKPLAETIFLHEYVSYNMRWLIYKLVSERIISSVVRYGLPFIIAGLLFVPFRALIGKLCRSIPGVRNLPAQWYTALTLTLIVAILLYPVHVSLLRMIGLPIGSSSKIFPWLAGAVFLLIMLIGLPLALGNTKVNRLLRGLLHGMTICAVCAVLLMCAGLIWGAMHRPDIGNRPNIILISIDTLRPDNMGCYGYHRNTTPRIDDFSKDSIKFTNCITPRTITTPAVVSMLTGLYPQAHGVRRLCVPLHPRYATLSEYLSNAGYHTGGVVCNRVLRDQLSGLAAGFDLYDEDCPVRGTKFGFPTYQRYAKDGNDVAYRWLDTVVGTKEPFFLWVHYFEPHGPYDPPEVFEEYSHEPRMVPAHEIPEYQRLEEITDEMVDVNAYIVKYDQEIRYTDHYTGRLLDKLKQLGVYDDALVIVTADHGESLTEHEFYINHGGYTYDACARVPLLIKLPAYVPGKSAKDNTTRTGQVSLIDLTPTILDFAGVYDRAYLDGTSIIPVMEGTSESTHEHIFIEKLNLMKAVRTDEWKYIIARPDGPIKGGEELYNLVRDPGETDNLLTDRQPAYIRIANALKDTLRTWQRDFRKLKKLTEVQFDEASRAELRSLGYLK